MAASIHFVPHRKAASMKSKELALLPPSNRLHYTIYRCSLWQESTTIPQLWYNSSNASFYLRSFIICCFRFWLHKWTGKERQCTTSCKTIWIYHYDFTIWYHSPISRWKWAAGSEYNQCFLVSTTTGRHNAATQHTIYGNVKSHANLHTQVTWTRWHGYGSDNYQPYRSVSSEVVGHS